VATVTIQAVHPVLMSSDILASVRFFGRLGFHESFRDHPDDPRYAAVARDGVQLHLQWHGPEQWENAAADRPTYRFPVSDVDRLHLDLLEAGALQTRSVDPSPWAAPRNTPWGTREFHVRDPDGNGLQFYQGVRDDTVAP